MCGYCNKLIAPPTKSSDSSLHIPRHFAYAGAQKPKSTLENKRMDVIAIKIHAILDTHKQEHELTMGAIYNHDDGSILYSVILTLKKYHGLLLDMIYEMDDALDSIGVELMSIGSFSENRMMLAMKENARSMSPTG
jgi:hypothetical protein